jgi:MoxR-like ATPase
LNTEQLLILISLAIQANVPVLLIGEPGVAKTAIIAAIAKQLDWPFLAKIGSVHDPTDFNGLPHMTERGVEMLAFRWAREFSEEALGHKRGLIFMDEFNMAQQSVMAAMLRMIHEGYVGDTKLGPGVARIAAMNPPEIANVPNLLPAMANRFAHFKWHLSPEYWVSQTIKGYPAPHVTPIPSNWKAHLPQAQSMVASYIASNTTALLQRPTTEDKWADAWPSPRTWDMATRLLAAAASIGSNDAIEAGLVESTVGAGAALGFMEYRRKLNLPNPEDVLKNPKGTKYPQKGDQLYALLNSVVSAVLNNNTEDRWMAAWDVMVYAGKDKIDIASASAKLLAQGRQPGYGTPKVAREFYPILSLAGIARPKVAA